MVIFTIHAFSKNPKFGFKNAVYDKYLKQTYKQSDLPSRSTAAEYVTCGIAGKPVRARFLWHSFRGAIYILATPHLSRHSALGLRRRRALCGPSETPLAAAGQRPPLRQDGGCWPTAATDVSPDSSAKLAALRTCMNPPPWTQGCKVLTVDIISVVAGCHYGGVLTCCGVVTSS